MNQEEIETAAQAVHYMLSRMGPSDQLKIIKLVFLADKYHLLHLGRTITRDDYLAMKRGPVPSMVCNVVYRNEDFLPENALGIPDKFFILKPNWIIEARGTSEYDLLSESDKSAIDFVVSKFGHKDHGWLIDYVHTFPEWKKHSAAINGGVRSVEMDLLDMFSVPNEADLDITESQAKESHDIYIGRE